MIDVSLTVLGVMVESVGLADVAEDSSAFPQELNVKDATNAINKNCFL